ncbi:MAG: UDP-N-acetylglucosamine--N-acetylmuramyl-(pentapeptide) pyrophosphoryl-undecaprenol N-acetylglucosamine transferase, partial [Proteobacteria bacterium]|nr:UDP-N-acetylglucosamine--N-acetylmuramyl-(pentapeptide) pyrophosphoryl-undecaprenol N-acetylglucosamine transferase [Pseudomonadota bacterium]
QKDLERVKKAYKSHGIAAEVFPFIQDIPGRLLWAHLVIGRAGASTLFELTAAGRPSILVPFPSAMDDHQSANAAFLKGAGAAWVFAEKEFTSPALAKLVQRLVVNQTLLKAAAGAALGIGRPEAAERLADLVEDMVLTRRERVEMKKPGKKSNRGNPGGLQRMMA